MQWNFQKYLVDHKGKVLAKFGPRDDPIGKEITDAVDAALKKRGPFVKKSKRRKKEAGEKKASS